MGFTFKVQQKIAGLISNLKPVVLFPVRVLKISKLIEPPTYYPEMERKSRGEMWRDNFVWLWKNKELNAFYTSSGLDVKDFRDPDDFLPRRGFVIDRNKGNQKAKQTISGAYNYIMLLRDKYVFAHYVQATMGKQYAIDTIALLQGEKAYLCDEGRWGKQEELLNQERRLVYKVIDGECADGVELVEVKADHVVVSGKKYSKQEFLKEHSKKRWIVQDVLEQHSVLKAFGTLSVNTVRIVTVKGKSGEVNVFSALLRLGANKESFVDNRATGGLSVGIDMDTGRLHQYGFPHAQFGIKVEVHPISGIVLKGYQLPYWEEVKALVIAAHKQFYEMQSIGWDVAITENGPVLLEGNDDWEIGGPQDTMGGLKERWNTLKNS